MKRRRILGIVGGTVIISGCSQQPNQPEEQENNEDEMNDDSQTSTDETDREPASFELSGMEPSNETVGVDEKFSITVTVENNGGSNGEKSIELRDRSKGDVLQTKELKLAAGRQHDISFEDVSYKETGSYQLTISSPDDEITGDISVEETLSESELRFIEKSESISTGGEWVAYNYESQKDQFASYLDELESGINSVSFDSVTDEELDNLISLRNETVDFVINDVYPYYTYNKEDADYWKIDQDYFDELKRLKDLGDENKFSDELSNISSDFDFSTYDSDVTTFNLTNPPLSSYSGGEETVIGDQVIGDYGSLDTDNILQHIQVYDNNGEVFNINVADPGPSWYDPATKFEDIDMSILDTSNSVRTLTQIKQIESEGNATYDGYTGEHQIISYTSTNEAEQQYQAFKNNHQSDGKKEVGRIGTADKLFTENNTYFYSKHAEKYVLVFSPGNNLWEEKESDVSWIYS